MDKSKQFQEEVLERIKSYADDEEFKKLAHEWMRQSMQKMYVYNFTWLGRPIIQSPQDVVAMQEIIWDVKPDLIIETGVAHGGSLMLWASMLEIIGAEGKVVGIDVEIREHNRREIEKHPLFKRIVLLEGSSVSDEILQKVREIAKNYTKIMVVLDSDHTHDHVKKELELYSGFVGVGSYLVAFDTFIEDMPPDFFPDRAWNVGNNPRTAVAEFLENNCDFEVDKLIENKLLVTQAPGGYLKRVK
jgi:cephalosporin hydroxylase